jgi:hypothetical protein
LKKLDSLRKAFQKASDLVKKSQKEAGFSNQEAFSRWNSWFESIPEYFLVRQIIL